MKTIEDFALAHVQTAPVYEPGKPISETAREMGLTEDEIVKLASNENPIGASGLVADALMVAMKDISRYPDGNGFALKQALGEFHKIDPASIILGNGSNEVIELLGAAFLDSSTSIVYSEYAFAVYSLMAKTRGAHAICVPSKHFGHDLNAMLDAIRTDTRLLVIANPNNPTGTYIEAAKMRAFLESVPPTTVVLLDEAYHEYLEPECRYNTIEWTRDFSNLIVARTFSKAYGLAGLRIGYGVAQPALVSLLNRVRQPFNTNILAQAAAIAALKDTEFLRRTYEVNQLGMAQICAEFDALGIQYIPSKANFVTFQVQNAASVFHALLRAGVIVRPLASYGLPDCLRVTVGLQTENEKFLQTLATIINRSD